MYKVFLNDSSVNLIKHGQESGSEWEEFPDSASLFPRLEELRTGGEIRHVHWLCDDLPARWEELSSHFTLIEAAGGLVLNRDRQILMIHRHGKWDLPKGKLEKSEDVQRGALREVTEECGEIQPEIIRELPLTYHTYYIKDRPVLKRTFWFEMMAGQSRNLVPQKEEGIEEVVWMNKSEIPPYLDNAYSSIRWLLQQYLS